MFIEENDVRTPRDRADGDRQRRSSDAVMRERRGGSRCGCQRQNAAVPQMPTLPREGRKGLNCRGEYAWEGVALAMVYSPYQHWQGVYDEDKGLSRGTIFAELDKPFEGSGSKGGCCI